MFEVGAKTLVDTLVERLAVVKVETLRCTLAKVGERALVNKLSASTADVEFQTINHTVVWVTAVNTLADMLTVSERLPLRH